MLTNSCKYSIRATIYLAQHASIDNKIGSKKISEDLIIPKAFLAKILKTLTKDKTITSVKGPGGGFYLTEKQKDKSVLDLIICNNGLISLNSKCFMGLPNCSDDNPCAVHHIVKEFKKNIIHDLSSKTINDLAKESEDGISFLV